MHILTFVALRKAFCVLLFLRSCWTFFLSSVCQELKCPCWVNDKNQCRDRLRLGDIGLKLAAVKGIPWYFLCIYVLLNLITSNLHAWFAVHWLYWIVSHSKGMFLGSQWDSFYKWIKWKYGRFANNLMCQASSPKCRCTFPLLWLLNVESEHFNPGR